MSRNMFMNILIRFSAIIKTFWCGEYGHILCSIGLLQFPEVHILHFKLPK